MPREKHTAVLTSRFLFKIFGQHESLVLPGDLSVFPWPIHLAIRSNRSAHQSHLGELKKQNTKNQKNSMPSLYPIPVKSLTLGERPSHPDISIFETPWMIPVHSLFGELGVTEDLLYMFIFFFF